MKNKILLFAGTTEGRTLAKKLKDAYDITACVATEYGEVLLPDIKTRTGRMTEEEMESLIQRENFDLIIDATHPYATEVTENIKTAAEKTKTEYIRIKRDISDVENAVHQDSIEAATEYLKNTEGNILLTTGSKDLKRYSGLDMSRIWARVLPLLDSITACEEAGLTPDHIIAAQGPFTEEENIEQIKAINAKYLVTKLTGKAGGFDEKINAARKTNAEVIIIGLPPQTDGITLEDAIMRLTGENNE